MNQRTARLLRRVANRRGYNDSQYRSLKAWWNLLTAAERTEWRPKLQREVDG